MDLEPTQTDPDKYAVLFENERVRALEYKDKPAHGLPPRSTRERTSA